MSKRAGALNWRRMVVNIPADPGGVDVDTGLTLPGQERAFLANSENEPRFDLDGAVGSRIQVTPLAPLTQWFADNPVTHDEAFLGPGHRHDPRAVLSTINKRDRGTDSAEHVERALLESTQRDRSRHGRSIRHG